MEKNGGGKSHATVPLKNVLWRVLLLKYILIGGTVMGPGAELFS
jgi:hypothetical protein